MHIDSDLLERAVELSGAASKTAAVDAALREFVRRGERVAVLKRGLGKTTGELKAIFEPSYDLEAVRLAETPPPYARKSRSR